MFHFVSVRALHVLVLRCLGGVPADDLARTERELDRLGERLERELVRLPRAATEGA